MRFTILAAALVLSCGGARAQTVPEYETLRWCFDRVPFGSYGASGIDACVDNEERDAVALQATYSTIPSAVRMECEAYATRVSNGWGSYNVLGSCLDDKLRRHTR